MYAARAVSLPALYTEPTAAQILPNFLFRAGARPPGRLLKGDALGQDQWLVRRPGLAGGGVVRQELQMGRWERMVRVTRWYGNGCMVPSPQGRQLVRTRHAPLMTPRGVHLARAWGRMPTA